jgi:hypothetical protein
MNKPQDIKQVLAALNVITAVVLDYRPSQVLAFCDKCCKETIVPPKGWDAACEDHFPRQDYDNELNSGERFTLEEFKYLQKMGCCTFLKGAL